jgi:flagellar hook-associated protein 3 FlgL
VGNRRLGDRFLFGGYKTLNPPIDVEGAFHGDDGQVMIEIASEVFISMNIPGSEVFNTHPKDPYSKFQNSYPNKNGAGEASLEPQNVNLFDSLQKIRIAVLAGDLDSVRDTLDSFDQLQSKLISLRAKVGARIQGLQSTERSLERHNLTHASLSSSLEDADMVQVVSDLGKEETVYRSALASSKRLIQPTLMDFLK